VLGLMPHPEHAVDPLLGSEDGALLLESFLAVCAKREGAR
jgi:phosphoribosylformylglycinamidine (FGAM) synthase-like amidotransferase family enzyme